jgi:hypothetical protein
MPDLSTLFAWTVAILAGLAVIGALAVVLTAEVYAIRRTLADYRARTTTPASSRYWPEHSAVRVVDGITDDERDQVRRMADRVLAGDRIQEIAQP